ncbi:MAG: hypothetical protein A2900_01410 [Candidatus Chisholmbacteria bacterium RIFCSPLOWO2_01_FULL_50_28]|uniref:Small ribosomal subunit protein bS20 n=1 Tax=Candidatus Chisholmbacteria bacterium RIFCSPHIGHO2_01_FULL_52_32 TaxID=1797591 RepID=A0A1G1VU29_9BACT|nr:MAG: hypothetical protein A2786_05330 [Candidatus Chisholmbacteria bacterium RIFCSPHIGHO2_01_FULL_52_32]OGY19747.1 MAG: hypothetical protein A2900_01410 [Candidatus Chisholmbacteria bacterium RIFCSPLOWO2_01_FULL_50_28]
MPVLPSAKRALRRDRRRAAVNRPIHSKMKRLRLQAMEDRTPELLAAAFSAIDRAAKKHVIHKHAGARLKSRLSLSLHRKG